MTRGRVPDLKNLETPVSVAQLTHSRSRVLKYVEKKDIKTEFKMSKKTAFIIVNPFPFTQPPSNKTLNNHQSNI